MDYRLKVIIDNVEMLETSETVIDQETGRTYPAPSISRVTLLDNATNGVMQIGSTPSDMLTFTINDPNKLSYDGEAVEFWVAPPDDDTDNMVEMAEIEDTVGEDSSDAGIDDEDVTDEFDDESSDGEEPTAEDLADAEAHNAEVVESQYLMFEGEDQPVESVTTDEGTEPEWRRVGIFYVDSQKSADAGTAVTLTCFDSMQKLNVPFTPAETTATVQDMYDDLCAQALQDLGVAIDEFDFDEDASREITWPVKTCSFRDALGWFAGLVGGFATCDDDASIGFSLYTFLDGIYLDSTLNMISKDASSDIEIDGIQCNVGVTKDNYIEAGFEPDITFDNPLMTVEILEEILETYNGIRWSGGELNITWDDSIIAGTFLRIMSPEEYANYLELTNALSDSENLTEDEILSIKESMNALGDVFMVSSQTIDFTGDATSTIISRSYSATQNANQMLGPASARMIRLGESIDGLETRIDTAEEAMDEIEGDITTLRGRVDDAEEDVTDTLKRLAVAQDIAGTLEWLTQHGTMALTQDTSVDPTHVYFVVDQNGDYLVGSTRYSLVKEPKTAELSTYYELTVTNSIENYVATHVSVTGEGLWLIPEAGGNKVLIAVGGQGHTYEQAGTYIIDGNDNILAQFLASGAQIGQSGGAHSVIDANGQRFYATNGTTQLANIGYDKGTNSSGGTSIKPYYSFGFRTTTNRDYDETATYSQGDTCKYDDAIYVCKVDITTPEEWTSSHWKFYIGNYSMVAGDAYAAGYESFASGNGTIALGDCSHAEGGNTQALAGYAHAEGINTRAGHYAHAEGANGWAMGDYSHAQNHGTMASKGAQTALGTYNEEDTSATTTHPSGQALYGQYAVIVGNGTADDARSNAFTIDWQGNVVATGKITAGGYSSGIRTQNVQLVDNLTVNTGAYGSGSHSVALTGWTPIGIIGMHLENASSGGTLNTYCMLHSFYLSGSSAYYVVRNFSTSNAKIKITATVLYVKA